MTPEDFGRYLSQQRELRGLSLGNVAQSTKISESLLTALETGHSDRLPERIFVVNYIRAYAQCIGIAPDEAILRYDEVVVPPPADALPQVLERIRRKKALIQMVVVLAALFGALMVLGLWMGRVPHPIGN